MKSYEDDGLDAMRRRHGAWRYWRWLGYLRGLWLWARVRWWTLRGRSGTIYCGPGLYIWPGHQRKLENLTFTGAAATPHEDP